MVLAAIVDHPEGLTKADVEIRGLEPPSRMSNDRVDQGREQQRKKLLQCNVGGGRKNRTGHTTSHEGCRITLVQYCDPGILTKDLGSRNRSSDRPQTYDDRQPNGQDHEFSHFLSSPPL